MLSQIKTHIIHVHLEHSRQIKELRVSTNQRSGFVSVNVAHDILDYLPQFCTPVILQNIFLGQRKKINLI